MRESKNKCQHCQGVSLLHSFQSTQLPVRRTTLRAGPNHVKEFRWRVSNLMKDKKRGEEQPSKGNSPLSPENRLSSELKWTKLYKARHKKAQISTKRHENRDGISAHLEIWCEHYGLENKLGWKIFYLKWGDRSVFGPHMWGGKSSPGKQIPR